MLCYFPVSGEERNPDERHEFFLTFRVRRQLGHVHTVDRDVIIYEIHREYPPHPF